MRNGARALTLVLLCATSDIDVAHVVSSPATPGQPSSLVRLAGLPGPGFRAVVRAPTDWVDPFVGTYGRGGTFPGATVPWGMVSASPHTGDVGWTWHRCCVVSFETEGYDA